MTVTLPLWMISVQYRAFVGCSGLKRFPCPDVLVVNQNWGWGHDYYVCAHSLSASLHLKYTIASRSFVLILLNMAGCLRWSVINIDFEIHDGNFCHSHSVIQETNINYVY